MSEPSTTGGKFTVAQEHYVTLLAGRIIRECETREEFLRNPREYLERWCGIKVNDQELQSIVNVVKEIGSTLDAARNERRVDTRWVKC